MTVVNTGTRELFTCEILGPAPFYEDIDGHAYTHRIETESGETVYTTPLADIVKREDEPAQVWIDVNLVAGTYVSVWTALDGSDELRTKRTSFTVASGIEPEHGSIVTVPESLGYTTIRGITEEAILKAQVWQETKPQGVIITPGLIERWMWLDSAHKRKNTKGRRDLDLLKRAVSFRAAALTPGLMDDFSDEFVAMGARLSTTWASVSQSAGSISGSFRERTSSSPEVDEDNPATRAAMSYLRKLSKNRRGPSARVGVNLTPTAAESAGREGWWAEPGDRFIVHRGY